MNKVQIEEFLAQIGHPITKRKKDYVPKVKLLERAIQLQILGSGC